MYKQKIVLSQVFWVEIRNLTWARRLLMVFPAFALAFLVNFADCTGTITFQASTERYVHLLKW